LGFGFGFGFEKREGGGVVICGGDESEEGDERMKEQMGMEI
jgi:hypothetical protein